MAHKPSASGFLASLTNVQAGPHVALAVSGGGDSMGLLALAARAAKDSQAPKFSVLSVDHGLRAAAQQEVVQVAATCARLGLPHFKLKADERLTGGNLQQKARDLRYRLMAKWCHLHGACLVLAHHQEDQAETVLMRLARGSGIDGLAAMAPVQTLQMAGGPLRLIRPFLDIASADLRQVAIDDGLPFVEDPSNQDRRFERVRWRQIMPQLAENGIDASKLAALAGEMRATKNAMNRRLEGWLTDFGDWHDYGVLRMPRSVFMDLPDAYQNRLLSRFIRYFGQHRHPPRMNGVERLRRAVLDRQHGAMTLGGIALRWRRETVFLGREAAACPSVEAKGGRIYWDRRFGFQMPDNQYSCQIVPLGVRGVQALRDAGHAFDDAVPAAYFAALPALQSAKGVLQCPLIDGNSSTKTLFTSAIGFGRDILGDPQDW